MMHKLNGRLRLLTASAALAMVMAATAPAFAETPKDTLVEAFAIDDVITMDPGEAFELTAAEITGNTYSMLVRLDINDTTKVVGDLALAPAGRLAIFGDRLENIFHCHLTVQISIRVQARLFRRYVSWMLCHNGPPWIRSRAHQAILKLSLKRVRLSCCSRLRAIIVEGCARDGWAIRRV